MTNHMNNKISTVRESVEFLKKKKERKKQQQQKKPSHKNTDKFDSAVQYKFL